MLSDLRFGPVSLMGLSFGKPIIEAPVTGPQDPDAAALVAAMTTAPSAQRQDLIELTVVNLKNANLFGKLAGLYLFTAHAEQAGLVNWVNPSKVGVNSGCAFDPITGFTRSAGAQKVTVPFPDAGSVGIYDLSAGAYAIETVAQDNRLLDTDRTAGGFLNLTLRSTPDMQSMANDATADTFARTVGSALYSVVRSGSSVKKLYKNGTVLGTGTTATTGLPVANSLRVFGAFGSTGQVRAAYIGQALTATEITDLAGIMDSYFQAVEAEAAAA